MKNDDLDRWIRFSDRMPEKYPVLAKHDEFMFAHVVTGYEKECHMKHKWFYCMKGSVPMTHWIPLSERGEKK